MTYEEFKEEVKKLTDKDYNRIQYNTEKALNSDTVFPNVKIFADAIRGNMPYDKALDFYKVEREKLKDNGDFWKEQFVKYLRVNTGYGYGDLNGFVNTFIEALKKRPMPTMDNPHKMEINWK